MAKMPIAVDEDNPVQHTPVIDAGFAMGFREKGTRRGICASDTQKRSDMFTARFRTVTPVPTRRSMGPDTGCSKVGLLFHSMH